MSSLALHIFTYFILAIYANEIAPNISCDVNHLLSENDGDIKLIPSNNSSSTIITTDERTVKKPISTSTMSSMTFKPTPTDSNQPTETTIATLEELGSVTLPNTVALPPPATTIEPHEFVTICGKMGNCYRWFDDMWALELSGYKKCEPRDERRAKRYCCIPQKPAL